LNARVKRCAGPAGLHFAKDQAIAVGGYDVQFAEGREVIAGEDAKAALA